MISDLLSLNFYHLLPNSDSQLIIFLAISLKKKNPEVIERKCPESPTTNASILSHIADLPPTMDKPCVTLPEFIPVHTN